MTWIEWYNSLAKPSWTPAPSTISLIWTLLYPIILVSFGFVFVQAYRRKVPWRVALPFAVKFVARDRGVLANNLYVAMTRARSVLAVFGLRGKSDDGSRIMSVLKECHALLTEVPAVQSESSMVDVAEELLRLIGVKHRAWLKSVLKKHAIEQDPIFTGDGEVIADPLFWFDHGGTRYACFNEEPKQAVANRLEDAGIKVLLPGAAVE